MSKIDPLTGELEFTFDVGSAPSDFAFDGVHVWVTNELDDTVMRLRRGTGTVQNIYQTENEPVGIVFDGTSIWVANSQANTVSKITPPR